MPLKGTRQTRSPALAIALGLYLDLRENGVGPGQLVPTSLWRRAITLYAEVSGDSSIRNYTVALEDLGLIVREEKAVRFENVSWEELEAMLAAPGLVAGSRPDSSTPVNASVPA